MKAWIYELHIPCTLLPFITRQVGGTIALPQIPLTCETDLNSTVTSPRLTRICPLTLRIYSISDLIKTNITNYTQSTIESYQDFLPTNTTEASCSLMLTRIITF